MKTVYDLLTEFKSAHLWKGALIVFPRAETLEKYFRVYSMVLSLEPERKYGYRKRILNHPDFIRLFGCQDELLIHDAIRAMEAPCDF